MPDLIGNRAALQHSGRLGSIQCCLFDSPTGALHGVNAFVLFRDELWVGTNAGVMTFDGAHFHPSDFGDLAATPVAVSCLLAEGDERLWAGTDRHGLFLLEDGRWRRLHADAFVTALLRDGEGRLLVATTRGLYVDDEGARFVPPDLEPFAGRHIRQLAKDETGRVWLVCEGELHCLEPGFGPWLVEGVHNAWNVFVDSRGTVWVAVEDEGVFRLGDGALVPFADDWPASPYEVDGIYEDGAGRLWFATRGGGLVLCEGDRLQTITSADGLADDKVSAVVQDSEGQVWAGHYLSGLSLLDFHTIERLSDRPVTEFVRRDPAGRVWFPSGAMLHCCAPSGEHTLEFEKNVMALTEGPGGVWVATLGDGIYRFTSWDALYEAALDPDPRKWGLSVERFGPEHGLPSESAVGLLRGRDGTLWAGTRFPGCLCRFDGARFETWETPAPTVFRIHEDPDGRIWCGGWNGGGLNCLENGVLRTYTTADGLPDDSVQCFLDDEAGLVVGTQYGGVLVDTSVRDGLRVRPYGPRDARNYFYQCAAASARGERWFGTIQGGALRMRDGLFQQTTRDDGLPGNSVSGLEPEPGGTMLVGTYHGLVRYRPTATRPPVAGIVRVYADGTHEAPSSLVLNATSARTVEFEFRGSSLSTRRLRYAFVLEGFDSDWRETWDASVRYEGIPEGDYVFRLRAIGRDLVASARDATLPVTVRTAPLEKRLREYETQLGEMERLLHEERRANRYNRALTDLATTLPPGLASLDDTLRRICETGARTLDVELCSVWLFDCAHGRIRCAEQFRATEQTHTSKELELERTPYFLAAAEALQRRRVISAPDAETHPASAPYYNKCFVKEDIRACLTAGVRTGGAVAGVLFMGYRGATRAWDVDEEQFVASLADLVSLALIAEDRRRAEEALRESERNLEQSQRLEAVGRLASGVAHDFNNLLTAMLGCTDLLLCQVQPPDPKFGLLEEIRDAGERAGALTRQLLAFSRKHEAEPRPLQLGTVVRDMERMLRRIIGEDVALDVETAPNERQILADPSQLELVLMNLAVNARDAMPEGGQLRVRTRCQYLRGGQQPPGLRGADRWFGALEVEDTGAGMDEHTMRHIFEPFYTTKGTLGTGLGLATVKGIVTRHGGAVTVQSAPGEGSTFRILLPCVDSVPDAAPDAAATPDAAWSEADSQAAGETVLVVEDEAMVRQLVSRMLESAGYRVELAPSADEALERLADPAFRAAVDLLVTDIVMPGASGADLTRFVREHAPDLPVVHMSGYSRTSDATNAGSNDDPEPDGFLHKPFRRNDLLAVVARALEKRSASRA